MKPTKKKKNLLSIDAGWKGAIAVKAISGKIVVEPCPSDSLGVISLFEELMEEFPGRWEVYMEANHASPKFGAPTNFSLGMNVGTWDTVFACYIHKVNLHPVPPKDWQKLIVNEHSTRKKSREKIKEKSWRYARKQFPNLKQLGNKVPNVRSPKQGIADALCILCWAMEA